MQEIMRNFAKKRKPAATTTLWCYWTPISLTVDDKDFLKSPSLLISGFAENNENLPCASASLREEFLSSTYVLVGKSIDDIDHEYFIREAGRSLYSFKT